MADAVKGKKKKLGQNPHGFPKTEREILAKKKKAIQLTLVKQKLHTSPSS